MSDHIRKRSLMSNEKSVQHLLRRVHFLEWFRFLKLKKNIIILKFVGTKEYRDNDYRCRFRKNYRLYIYPLDCREGHMK
jgi:hypothetical protein